MEIAAPRANKKIMKKSRLFTYFTYGFILAIGIVVGIAIRHYHNIPLSGEINLIDLATLVVTVFLAVYIPEVLDHKLQNTRDKKLLLENRITEYQTLLKKVNALVQDDKKMNQKDYLVIRNTLDVAQHKLDTVVSLLSYANLQRSFEKEVTGLQALAKEHEDLLLADRIGDEGFSYPQETQDKEEMLYNELDKASSLLIFHISDS